MADLPPKQRRFCEEYLVDLNGAAAARRAGYSASGARQEAERLLTKADVQAELQGLMAARSKRTEVTADTVVMELAKLGFSNMLDYVAIQDDGTAIVDLSNVDRDRGAAMQEVTVETYTEGRGDDAVPVKRVKFKLADKRGSLELLGRHLGLFDDKLRLSGNVTVNIADELARRSQKD